MTPFAKNRSRFFHRLNMPGSHTVGVRRSRTISLSSPRQNPVIKRILALNARLTQRNRFIERSHAQPTRAFGFECTGTLHRTVPVGIGLHHGAHRHARAHVLLHGAKVFPQGHEGYFGPGGACCHAAQNFCSACHFRDYSGSARRLHVTPGLLPSRARSGRARVSQAAEALDEIVDFDSRF